MDDLNVVLDDGAFKPVRGHENDAGLDLKARHAAYIPARGSATFRTGVHVAIPKNCCGLLVSKSGLNVVNSVTSTGLIDSGYTGEIVIKLYNDSDVIVHILAGQKISQLVILPYVKMGVKVVSSLDETERGDNGFGSTGKF